MNILLGGGQIFYGDDKPIKRTGVAFCCWAKRSRCRWWFGRGNKRKNPLAILSVPVDSSVSRCWRLSGCTGSWSRRQRRIFFVEIVDTTRPLSLSPLDNNKVYYTLILSFFVGNFCPVLFPAGIIYGKSPCIQVKNNPKSKGRIGPPASFFSIGGIGFKRSKCLVACSRKENATAVRRMTFHSRSWKSCACPDASYETNL